MIPVTKPYLPNKQAFKKYVDQIYSSGWLTNRGALVRELEERLCEYLGVKHLICVANGSIALQIAYKALNLKGEVITTPFSFAATTSTLCWEGLLPRFADIDRHSLNITPKNVESLISPHTDAILPVHVFGNACEVECLEEIANKYDLRLLYDGAHCFDTWYETRNKNKINILNYGDISTLSFHATKLFHTVEGGAIVTSDGELAERVRALLNFGIEDSGAINLIGTNAKMNEFEAAMGLCVLDEIQEITSHRSAIWQVYTEGLKGHVEFQIWNKASSNNHSYAPVLFKNENQLLRVQHRLNGFNIFCRRYFYPSLDSLSYVEPAQKCEVSRSVADRVLCLPIHTDVSIEEAEFIVTAVKKELGY